MGYKPTYKYHYTSRCYGPPFTQNYDSLESMLTDNPSINGYVKSKYFKYLHDAMKEFKIFKRNKLTWSDIGTATEYIITREKCPYIPPKRNIKIIIL